MRLSVAEMFGLHPIGERLRETALALRGDPQTPKARYDVSSLKMFRPKLATTLWLGKKSRCRQIALYNLFNHHQSPPALGWSVRVTDVLDFRGRKLSYDSHNGTDFAIAPGTSVRASASGSVMRVSSEFNRGGLKVFIDHGRGLITTYNHLGRSLVSPGRRVTRGQEIALSGYSGLDGLVTFPWGAPHVHYNVWLNGSYVDPFESECDQVAKEGSIWRKNNRPLPTLREEVGSKILYDDTPQTEWDPAGLEHAMKVCLHPETRSIAERCTTAYDRGAVLMFNQAYFPTRFSEPVALYSDYFDREPRLDLPFTVDEFDGVYFPDEG